MGWDKKRRCLLSFWECSGTIFFWHFRWLRRRLRRRLRSSRRWTMRSAGPSCGRMRRHPLRLPLLCKPSWVLRRRIWRRPIGCGHLSKKSKSWEWKWKWRRESSCQARLFHLESQKTDFCLSLNSSNIQRSCFGLANQNSFQISKNAVKHWWVFFRRRSHLEKSHEYWISHEITLIGAI